MKKVALVVIATGEKYWQYIEPLLESARRFFVPHDVVLFTDSRESFDARQIEIADRGYPETTLHRYHLMLSQRMWLETFDYIFYVDVDMLFVNQVGGELFSSGITATIHPGFIGGIPRGLTNFSQLVPYAGMKDSWRLDYDRNPASTAYVPNGLGSAYYCGGFQGGQSAAFLEMAEKLRENIDLDSTHRIRSKWHDESHYNRYLIDHPPAKVLSPAYCFPEELPADYRYPPPWHEDEAKIIGLQKAFPRYTERCSQIIDKWHHQQVGA